MIKNISAFINFEDFNIFGALDQSVHWNGTGETKKKRKIANEIKEIRIKQSKCESMSNFLKNKKYNFKEKKKQQIRR